MTIVEQFLQDGDRLFRWRSYFPLLLVPVLVMAVLREAPVFGSLWAERVWETGSVLVALAGLVVRGWAVGTAPSGTSERSTVSPRASELRTSGLYSILRHPLYLANGLMAFGISLFPAIWYLPPIVFLATLVYYERIAAREEQFLESVFGATFREWAGQVPAIVPRFGAYAPSTTPMSWKKTLRGEFHGLLVIAGGVLVLELAQVFARSGRLEADRVWLWLFLGTAAAFLVARTLKKTTRVFES